MNALERLKAANQAKEQGQAPGPTPATAPVQVMDATKAVETVAQALPVATSTAAEHRLAMLARLKGGPVNPPEWQPPPANAEARDTVPAPAMPTDQPQKRHRRTKAEMEAARAAQGQPVQATLSAAVIEGTQVTTMADSIPVTVVEAPAQVIRADVSTVIGQPTTVSLTTDMPIPYLLIDCISQGLEVESLSNVIAMASAMICKAQNVGDYRYIDFKGLGMLVEAVCYIIKTNPGKSYHMASDTPEGRGLLNPLCALSAIVIRGVR